MPTDTAPRCPSCRSTRPHHKMDCTDPTVSGDRAALRATFVTGPSVTAPATPTPLDWLLDGMPYDGPVSEIDRAHVVTRALMTAVLDWEASGEPVPQYLRDAAAAYRDWRPDAGGGEGEGEGTA